MTDKVKVFRKKVRQSLAVQQQEVVNVPDALGRVLAADVRARYTSPNKDIACIDGYAIISSDVPQIPAHLHVAGESKASHHFMEELMPGQAVKVFAGARVPIGADSVIPLSGVHKYKESITVNEAVMFGENVCPAGIDFTENEKVLREGSVITARDIGLTAAMKVSWLPVRRKPRIGVLAIGDELAMLGDVTEDTRTTSSTSLALCAFIATCGAQPINLGIATDASVSGQYLTDIASGVDLLVTTGGLSASADNLLLKALTSRNAKIDDVTLALGKDELVVLGRKGQVSILSFPGNPISAQICATLFLRPAIEKMLHIKEMFYRKNFAILGRQLDVNDEKMDYIFAKLSENTEHRLTAEPASSQDRLLFSALANADCLITVNKQLLSRGSPVEITHFNSSVISG